MPKPPTPKASTLSQSLMTTSATTSSQSNDPYFRVRDGLSGRLQKLQNHFENWEVLLRTENTESSAAFKKAHADLQKKVNTAKRMALELGKTVSHVKQKRAEFSHISDADLSGRQKFVDEAKATIKRIQDTIRSPATQGKIDSDRNAVLAGGGGGGSKMTVSGNTTKEYIQSGKEYQQRVLESQDRDMEEIDIALDGIKDAGQDIYNEIESQNQLLEELNEDVKTTQTAMDKVNDSLQKMLATKDGCQLGIVIAMSIICVISVILVITTFL